MNILITGGTGFVGTALLKRLGQEEGCVSVAVLAGERTDHLPPTVGKIVVPPLSGTAEYGAALQGIDIVVHLAARVHVMQDAVANPLEEFRKVNVTGTERLARQAAAAGVRRLVFMSSVKVNGEGRRDAYCEEDPPAPADPYGISKWEAETVLADIAKETGLEVVCIRSPLVYGPGVKANFLNMLKVIAKGLPLPLASVVNQRSLIYVGNLADALTTCAKHPAAAGQTYLLSDGEDVSTPELIRRTAKALDAPARLFPVPSGCMCLAGKLVGKSDAVERLLGSLTVDSRKIRRELGWLPPFSLDQGLAETAKWFLSSRP